MTSNLEFPVYNQLLLALPRPELAELLRNAERVPLHARSELFAGGAELTHVYFIESGVVSLLTMMEDGSSVESATIGYEGFVPAPAFLGATETLGHHVIQGSGEAFTLTRETFLSLVETLPRLRALCNGYAVAHLESISQTAACNRVHPVDERCARWLLQMADRNRSDEFMLTQEFLATMLGVRRPSVTVAAGILQKAGIISYRRGRMAVRDRERLEQAACECYFVIRDRFQSVHR